MSDSTKGKSKHKKPRDRSRAKDDPRYDVCQPHSSISAVAAKNRSAVHQAEGSEVEVVENREEAGKIAQQEMLIMAEERWKLLHEKAETEKKIIALTDEMIQLKSLTEVTEPHKTKNRSREKKRSGGWG